MVFNSRWTLALIWACFLLRALFYCSVIPLWEGYDEFSHFAFIQHFAATGTIPDARHTNSSREVQESMRLTPMPWMQRDLRQNVTHDAWWRLPFPERAHRERRLRALPPQWATETPQDFVPIYEAQQPPLYYVLLSAPYRLLSATNLVTRVWWLRLFTAALASLVIPLGFLTAREILGNVRAALAVTVLIASMPELMLTVCRIGNDALAVVTGTLCLLLAFRSRDAQHRTQSAALLGIATGLALLTKAYFLALLPPLALLPLLAWRKSTGSSRRTAVHCLLLAAGPLLIAGWWYARNLLLTGSISGAQMEVASRRFSTPELLHMIARVPWLKAADFVFLSHIWHGDWSFLVLRSWMYHLFALVWIVAAVGFAARYFSKPPRQPSRTALSLLAAFYLSFLLAMAYHALLTFGHEGHAGSLGFYLCSMVVAEAVLLLLGLDALLPARLGRGAIALLTLSFAALEAFGLFFYMIPYYTGVIAHLENGNLPTLQLGQLARGGAYTILERLTMNKPDFLNVPALIVIGLLLLLATLTLVAMNFSLACVSGHQPKRE
jgi:4-amino-4-deoxy-L-arabinose transferase-like glycosyltransferase